MYKYYLSLSTILHKMCGIQSKIQRLKKSKTIHSQEMKQMTQLNLEMTQILEIVRQRLLTMMNVLKDLLEKQKASLSISAENRQL